MDVIPVLTLGNLVSGIVGAFFLGCAVTFLFVVWYEKRGG
jgi:hypothetical protein